MVVKGVRAGAAVGSGASIVAGLWLLLLAGLWGRASGGMLLAQYPGPADPPMRFSHLAVDHKTKKIFAAGTNRLLQLDADLNLEYTVMTGPRNDSPLCHATGCHGTDIPFTLTNNYNKILLIEPESRTLISCGSIFQGACYKYKLNNISAEPEFIPRAIAANDANSSTYAYIGPKSYNLWGRSNILYVGTTFTNNGEYRHDVPAIASRDLDTLDIAEYSFSKQSHLSIDVKYRDHFIVQYVYGFNASDYAYFLIVQKQSHLPGQEEQGYVSRLSRTCINDANYDSYTEVTLQCVDGDQKYNLVQDAKIATAGDELANSLGILVGTPILIAVFRPARGITNEPQPHSALCLYPLRDIEAKFIENIHMCFNGSVKYRNMGYVSGLILDGKCPTSGSAGNIPNFCEVGLKISGATPIVSNAALVFPNISLSAVATASTGRHVLAFLGTTDGKLKKVLLSGPVPTEYEEVVVDEGNAILPDTTLSTSGDYLYVLSTSKISKINVEHCSSYNNCSACLESKDPYCGWCSLEKKCTVRSACLKASHSPPRWLSLGTGQQCIDFEQVLPEQIPINQMTTVRLTIKTLPELPYGAKYKCVFGSAEPIDAVVTEFGLSCPTPDVLRRPQIPPQQDHVLVPLSVRSSETNKDFVSRNFAYYDCSKHTTCMQCVKSQWACNWCVYENKCTHNASSLCQRNVISGENNPVHLSNHGFEYCPQFRRRDVILLPTNVPKQMIFEVKNLPHPQAAHSGFQCIIIIEGATMLVPARVVYNKHIVCDNTTVSREKIHPIYSYEANEGEYEANVTVVWNRNHHIDSMTVILYKCDILGSHREHADCSLCVTRNSKYQCTWCGNTCTYSETCQQIPHIECPRPRIDMIKPLSGPIEGGTLVTIEGSNLGLKKGDVQGKIKIGDVPCELVNYEVSVKIQCVTGPSKTEQTAPIIVGNEAGFTKSSVEFSYKDIKLFGIDPSKGPLSGGTQLAIKGQYLNIGSEITAYLDDYVCQVNLTQASSGRLTCITSKAQESVNIAKLTLSIDGANRTLKGNPFNYTQDPTIMEIKPLKSFVSGGRMIFVHGTNLSSIQAPEMEVYSDGEPSVPINKTSCTVLSATQIECPSPSVNRQFLLASTRVTRSLRQPSAIKMPEAQLLVKIGDTLVIEGENLNMASDETDVVVTIGTKPCNVTGLAMSQLVCSPPEQQPLDTDENGVKTDTNLPLVVVRVGRNLRFPLGYLRYDIYKSFAFPPEAVAMVATGTILFVFFFVAILVVYRRKSTQAEREYKRIQIQMDTLESNVRSECKLDMTDLTADLENSGIPTLDHTSYIMKVFFPGVSDHPILNAPKVRINGPRTNYDSAMLQFEQLINNKHFVLVFIEILESQKSFNIRDKVTVASLLMVVLMGKMEYATDILKSLLLRLIDKSVNTKHPQLMLRRTESKKVWLMQSHMMHVILCLKSGCCENKWNITLHIVQDDLDEKIQCKVLDCDTISQVKSKILDALFKNTPFSLRPSIYEVDLEWRHGRGGHLTLQDEDLTTKTVGSWKKLNTLAHYGVKESAVMSLISRQNDSVAGMYFNNSQSPIITTNGDVETGTNPRIYHLVKPIDDHQFPNNKLAERTHKAIPEIFLTRLLSTKGTIQKFVDDFFLTILTVNEALPPAVKWLFDLLDEAARKHGIQDPEVVHAWKSNSLPLRFWVNFIKNPDFIFDINKTTTLDSCLSVIAQTFMDSCSTTEHRLGKDSPSNKLLFAKDIPRYREMVSQFYHDVASLPVITDQEMGSAMQQLSAQQADEFDTVAALKELYIYVTKYREQIIEALNGDINCRRLHLAQRLDGVAYTLGGEDTSAC
ncbi:plexin-B [Asbolus verrucosus]|uniref:Plexin-B n=1 Tax=Asbolus verrucosus TaxID=1661398 RepID=A0A482VUY7_ASBVE|nr:plexin-B [Asbolus verrucosus]